jgi:Mg2+ and Co2+ transporter CorA
MQVIHLLPGQAATLSNAAAPAHTEGFFWVDLCTAESDWLDTAAHWLDGDPGATHLLETIHKRHYPFYDGTDTCDLLVFGTLDPASPAEAPTTRTVAMLATERVLISIRPDGDEPFARLEQRLLAGLRKSPATTAALLALLINQIVDRLLARRETVSELIEQWQEQLLGPDRGFDDWQSLMRLRCHLRRLETVSEDQLDALSAWREQTGLPLDAQADARFDELRRDLSRVFDYAAVMQTDIDSLLQTHYAAVGQRTNEILRFLTVISTVFLPLNLIAGIFGMNFVHIPFLQSEPAPFLTLGCMALVAVGLMLWSRKKRWF